MKKITFLTALMVVFSLNAQVTVFEEDFDGSGPGFGAWTATDVDGQAPNANDYSLAVNTQGWAELDFETQVLPSITATGFDQLDIAGLVMGSHSWYSPVGQSDDWVTSPLIDLSGASGLIELEWDAVSVAGNPSFNEDYRVLVSTSTDDLGDFVEVADITLEENAAPSTRTVDLSAFAGESIYIAFHNDSNDRWGVVVDNISVTAATLNVVDVVFNNFSYFVDANNVLNLRAGTPMQSVELFSVIGQQVVSQKLSNSTETIDISNLESGVYITRISINGLSKSYKIIKR
jgi:hypothetical protein